MTTADLPDERRTWITLEPIHGMVYFAPQGPPIYDALGLRGAQHYFAPRSAALGAANAETVIATFYNFSPTLVRSAIPSAWDVATPAKVLDARYRVVDAALRAAGGELLGSGDVAAAAGLAREAALVACERLEGRPLFAAHASLPWPDEPHLVLWHAQTLLREFRGDGHLAALVSEGLTGCEALVSHAASGVVPAETLRTMRQWRIEEWNEAADAMRSRGLLEPTSLTFTPEGVAQRERIEHCTDVLAAAPYRALGAEGCALLRRAARPLAQAIAAMGWTPVRRQPPTD